MKIETSIYPSYIKIFSLGFSFSIGKVVCRGKVAYIWIFPYPAKVGPALGVIVVHKYLEGMMCFSGTEVWDHKRKNTLKGMFFSTCNK